MDAGECTVQVCWQSPEELTETDIQELFAPFGHVFKSEMDTEQKSAVLCYSERKAALTAATKYSKYINDPSKVDRRISKNSVFQKMFCIQTTQLGAEVFVGGLDSGVTTVKLKRGKQL
jgi:RNA recognition motif-containing protein